MSVKQITQLSLADSLLMEHQALTELDDLHNLLDWSVIQQLLKPIYNKRQGNVAYAPLIMFKALLLQTWYNLSDVALEKQLARDLMFKRFVGLSLSDTIPDHATIWRFREQLKQQQLMPKLLQTINRQMQQQGIMIMTGSVSIIDATITEAKQSRPHQRADGSNTQDAEAAWTTKTNAHGKRQSTYGYKAHINVDEDGIVKHYATTPANVHDSQVFEQIIDAAHSSAVYADSAYKSQAHDDYLAQQGIKNRILEKGYRNRPLTKQQKRSNRIKSQTRSLVESVFGIIKQHYGAVKCRYMGLARNHLRLGLLACAYNLKRCFGLWKEMRDMRQLSNNDRLIASCV